MDFTELTSSADLATELKAAGGKLDETSRTTLEVLVDDLRNSVNLDRWAEIDLAGTLARPENFVLDEPRKPSRYRPGWLPHGATLERTAEAVLGIFVFIPLLITWLGLFSAAHAYGELASSDKLQATRPFLQLWESGFDGRLSHWLWFGDVAGFAVFFISMLLLLALLHSASRYWTQRAEDHRRGEADQASARLAALLTRTQLNLVGYRLTSPAQFTNALSQSAQMLRDLINDARLAQDSVTTVLAEAARISTSLDNAADKMNGATEKMNGATDVIGEAATRVTEILREGTGALTEILNNGTTALTDAQRTGAAELKNVVDEGVKSLREGQQAALDAMAESTQAGVKALDSARTMTQQAVAAATQATQDAARQNADALHGVQDRLGQAGEQVEAAVRDLTDVQRQLSERSDRVAQAAEQMADSMLVTARQSSDSARQLVDQANISLGELTNIVDRWDQAAAHWVAASRVVEQRIGPLADGSANGHDGMAAARGGGR